MRMILTTVIGAGLGYVWYRLVGCSTGSCPITARWWTSVLYGAVMGGLAGAG